LEVFFLDMSCCAIFATSPHHNFCELCAHMIELPRWLKKNFQNALERSLTIL
jgi:hypothetical protein